MQDLFAVNYSYLTLAIFIILPLLWSWHDFLCDVSKTPVRGDLFLKGDFSVKTQGNYPVLTPKYMFSVLNVLL